MATKLRLEIHRISLQHMIVKDNDKTWEDCKFCELIDLFDKDDKQKAFATLWTKFVEQFDDKFVVNTDGDKAVTATNSCKHTVSPLKNIINGEFYGGTTNREQSIYKRKNARKSTNTVAADDVVSSNFYVKMWLPYDYTTGALMIQSYSTSNISDLVKVNFAKFVQKYQFRIGVTSYYPKTFMEERNKLSNVVSVTYVKDKLTKGSLRLVNPIFADLEGLKIKVEITGFRKPVNDFWKVFNKNGKSLRADINPLAIKKDDEDVMVMAKYVDEEGRSTTMNLDQNRIRNFAYYLLPEEVMQMGKNTYDFKKITKHTDSILETIKKETGYTKIKRQ